MALELQADCYAGVWSKLADDAGQRLDRRRRGRSRRQDAAAAVGDDRIQQQTQGRVDQESWTHGSAAQRKKWFTTGTHHRRRERLRHLHGRLTAPRDGRRRVGTVTG